MQKNTAQTVRRPVQKKKKRRKGYSGGQLALAIVLLGGLVLTQAAEPRMLMALLALVEPWLLLALGMTALTMIPLAIIRRKRP